MANETGDWSTQNTECQQEAANRLHLPFCFLSDEGLLFTKALTLPTVEVEGRVLLKRLTLIIIHGLIEKVFYPVFPLMAMPSKFLAGW